MPNSVLCQVCQTNLIWIKLSKISAKKAWKAQNRNFAHNLKYMSIFLIIQSSIQ